MRIHQSTTALERPRQDAPGQVRLTNVLAIPGRTLSPPAPSSLRRPPSRSAAGTRGPGSKSRQYPNVSTALKVAEPEASPMSSRAWLEAAARVSTDRRSSSRRDPAGEIRVQDSSRHLHEHRQFVIPREAHPFDAQSSSLGGISGSGRLKPALSPDLNWSGSRPSTALSNTRSRAVHPPKSKPSAAMPRQVPRS